MRRLKSETCVSKEAPCVRWYSQVCCNVVALQGQMKINVLPLSILAASTVLNVRPPLARLFWFPPKSKRLVLAIPCKSILYACMLCTLSIALQGQIRLQAASSHATCSLVRLRKSIFGFWVSFPIWFLKGRVMLILWLICGSHLHSKTEYIQDCFVVCY